MISTLQRLASVAFIGPMNGQGRRGDKVDNLVYLALWCLARDWWQHGCGRRRPVPVPVGQQLKLHQEIARRLWISMTRQDKFNILNGSGEMGNTHYVCAAPTTGWMTAEGSRSRELRCRTEEKATGSVERGVIAKSAASVSRYGEIASTV